MGLTRKQFAKAMTRSSGSSGSRSESEPLEIGLLAGGTTGKPLRQADATCTTATHAGDQPFSSGISYGASVATTGLIKALMTSEEALRLVCYTDYPPYRSVNRERLVRRPLASLTKGSIPDLMLDPRGSLYRAFEARSASRRIFPITAAHHTLSYRDFLYGNVVRLLVAPSLACDTLVCSSRAARVALSKMLEQVSHSMRSNGRRFAYRGDIVVIPYGVDTSLYRPRSKAEARARFGIPETALVILYAGRLSVADKMDLLPLLRVFKHLVNDFSDKDLVLAIAGEATGGYEEVLRRDAMALGLGDRVCMISGRTAEMHWVYPTADIFVSPCDNIQESFGLTPIEAMACGVPQVGSDWNGYRDTIRHARTGFLVPTQWTKCDQELVKASPLRGRDWYYDHLFLSQSVVVDFRLLNKSLAALISSEELRKKFGQESRRIAVEDYDWKQIVARFIHLWRDQVFRAATEATAGSSWTTAAPFPSYFTIFNHYASEIMGNHNLLEISKDGRDLIAGKVPMPPLRLYSDKSITDPDLVLQIVKSLNNCGGTSKACDIVGACGSDRDRIDILRHLMWLLKYGFVVRTKSGCKLHGNGTEVAGLD